MRLGFLVLVCCAFGSALDASPPQGGGASVSGVVSVVGKGTGGIDNSRIAVWLKPVSATGQPINLPPARLKIVQQNKRFDPSFLVMRVGSTVDFPNLDPFFHNVFSMFDGKRFDLGLYEAGASRRVSFTTPGVCYIFCNIHPEMAAVLVVVDTPYYTTTNRAGEFALSNVPPGRYQLSVWHERHKPEHPNDFPRDVIVSGGSTSLGTITLVQSDEALAPHKNKYGHDYVPPAPSSPVYK